MRKFSEVIYNEIARELAFIWSAHRIHNLQGKMRLFTPAAFKDWTNNDSGIEIWFGPNEIADAIKKLKLFYRSGIGDTSTLLLDPVVYDVTAEPIPIGSGVMWGTARCKDSDEEISDTTIKRLNDLGIFTSLLHHRTNQRAGIKMLAYTKKPALPTRKKRRINGIMVQGCKEICDIANISADEDFSRHYMLSGLEYRTPKGRYQSISFHEMYKDETFSSITDIKRNAQHIGHILDAATCWNAYGRDTYLYSIYGADIANLANNLQEKGVSDTMVGRVSNELDLLWASNKRTGLEGKMRLFTVPNQNKWRSKQEGFEYYFDATETHQAASEIGKLYNAGKLPNTPLLLDPIVYQEDQHKKYKPVGCSIVWATGLNTGLEKFDEHGSERLKALDLYTGHIIRAGQDISGLKAVGFLREAYRFSPEEIKKFDSDSSEEDALNHANNEDVLALIETSATNSKSDKDSDQFMILNDDGTLSSPEDGNKNNTQDGDEDIVQFEDEDEDNVSDESETNPFFTITLDPNVKDIKPIEGCKPIFDIIKCNGHDFWGSYLLTGMEYLCKNGSFANLQMQEPFPENDESRAKMLDKHTVDLEHMIDAGICWESYDRMPTLWDRFGVNIKDLEENLTYYNLCGRDFELLNMTGDAREDSDDDFEFFAQGWIPKSAVTVLVATGGTGKSSLAHRLAILASIDWEDHEPNPGFLGAEIRKEDCKGLAIYFSGEDSPAIVNARAEMIDPEGRSKRLLVKYSNDFDANEDGSEGNIGDFLHYLDKLPEVSVCVIDPARKYLIGDEEDAEIVGDFFEAIEEFAMKKKCAMIVVHHMSKGAKPNDSRDMLDLLRGSQVFIDRPRVVIGLYKDNAHTIAGLSKNNIPPGLGMVEGERIFVRDPKHLDLFWVPGPEGVRTFTVSEEELEQIRAEAEAKAAQIAKDEAKKIEA
jgi:hypothetical protein